MKKANIVVKHGEFAGRDSMNIYIERIEKGKETELEFSKGFFIKDVNGNDMMSIEFFYELKLWQSMGHKIYFE